MYQRKGRDLAWRERGMEDRWETEGMERRHRDEREKVEATVRERARERESEREREREREREKGRSTEGQRERVSGKPNLWVDGAPQHSSKINLTGAASVLNERQGWWSEREGEKGEETGRAGWLDEGGATESIRELQWSERKMDGWNKKEERRRRSWWGQQPERTWG